MERRKDVRFILTGSSARKLKQGGVDLLAGRAIRMELHPFLALELRSDFVLERNLRIGTVPLVVDADAPTRTLATYLGTYMEEEVKAEGFIRNLQGFARFLEVMSFSHGQQVNAAEIARESGIGRTSVQSYLEILEDLLVAYTIPVFAARAKRAVVSSRKFYYFDTGVFQAVRPKGPLDKPQEIDGAALEGLVGQHLRAWIAYRAGRAKLYYWRTRGGNEVDFVVYGEDTFHAIEVKHTATVRSKDLGGLRSFRDDYPEAVTTLVYRGTEALVVDGIHCIPCEEFLRSVDPTKPLMRPLHSASRS